MEKIVMLTEAEYEEMQYEKKRLLATCFKLKDERDKARSFYEMERGRVQNLWDILNRQAIEEAAIKRNDDFYAWCAEKAAEYERKDEEEWMLDRARFYNNGMNQYANKHNIENTCEEVERYRKYGDGCKHWYSTKLMKECDDEDIEVSITEGWSELAYRFCSRSFVLPSASSDIFNRYFNMATGWKSQRARRFYQTLEKMKEECGSWEEYCR